MAGYTASRRPRCTHLFVSAGTAPEELAHACERGYGDAGGSSTRTGYEDDLARTPLRLLGFAKPTVFAYPNGAPGRDYSDRDVDLVGQCGSQADVSPAPAVNDRGADTLQLRRFTIWDRNMIGFGLRCAVNLSGHGRAPVLGRSIHA